MAIDGTNFSFISQNDQMMKGLSFSRSLHRAREVLDTDNFLAKFPFDTAENDLFEIYNLVGSAILMN